MVDLFVDEPDLGELGFEGAAATGRPGYDPATMLKLYIYGYLNQVQSSRRLERGAGRDVECQFTNRVREENGINHRLTKVKHPWTNGRVERTNQTIKEAAVKPCHYDSHDLLR